MRSVKRGSAVWTIPLLALLSCGEKKEPTIPVEPAPVETPALVDAGTAAKPVIPDAAPETAFPDAAPSNVHALDLDGDGKKEEILVADAQIQFGGKSYDHGLAHTDSRPIKVSVIDIDSSDGRNELLLQLTEYEALKHHVFVFMRDGKFHVSNKVATRDLKVEGDGKLRSTNWFQGKRSERVHTIQGGRILPVKRRKKGRK
jgi:hypothetical protein